MGVNYKWRKAFSIPKIGFSIADRERENFPELIDCGRIARMQHPTDLHAERVLANTLIDVCKSDELPHTAETTKKMTSPAKTVDTHRRDTLFGAAARVVYTVPAKYKDATTYLLTAPAFAAWLTAQGEEQSEHVAAWVQATEVNTQLAPKPTEPSELPDLSLLVTRDQLVAAFGRHTGMDASWFKKLDVGTQLMKARKVRGQGGRGHTTEPFFCPYLVMLFLIDPKRKKGNRKIKETTGWRLLKLRFPKVHAIHAEFDPNAD